MQYEYIKANVLVVKCAMRSGLQADVCVLPKSQSLTEEATGCVLQRQAKRH